MSRRQRGTKARTAYKREDLPYAEAMKQLQAKASEVPYKNMRIGTVRREVVEGSRDFEGEPSAADAAALDQSTQALVTFKSRAYKTKLDRLRDPTTKAYRMVFGSQANAAIANSVPLLTFSFDDPIVGQAYKKGDCFLLPEKLEFDLTTTNAQDLKVTAVGLRALPGQLGHGEGEGWAYVNLSVSDFVKTREGVATGILLYSRPYDSADVQRVSKYGAGVLPENFGKYNIVMEHHGVAALDVNHSLVLCAYQAKLKKMGEAFEAQEGPLHMLPLAEYKELGPDTLEIQKVFHAPIDLSKLSFLIEPIAAVDERGVPMEATFTSHYGASKGPDTPITMNIAGKLTCRICDVSEKTPVAHHPMGGGGDDMDYDDDE